MISPWGCCSPWLGRCCLSLSYNWPYELEPPSALGGIITIAATGFAAQKFAQRERVEVPRGQAWTLSALMALIAFTFTNSISALALMAWPEPGLTSMLTQTPVSVIGLAALAIAVVYVLLIRLIFPMFVRSALKRMRSSKQEMMRRALGNHAPSPSRAPPELARRRHEPHQIAQINRQHAFQFRQRFLP